MNRKSLTLLFLTALCVLLAASCSFTDKTVPVNSVALSKEEYTFTESGDTLQLAAVVKPDDATERRLIWSSSDEKVAIVTQFGLVTSLNDGEAYIFARSKVGEAVSSCKITVTTYTAVSGITLAETSREFTAFGEAFVLGFEVLPSNATEKGVLWSSSSPDTVSVDSNGVVIPRSNGTAVITATTVDGGFSASCLMTVNVDLNVPMTDVNFNISAHTFTSFDENLVLIPVWTPEDTTERGLTWSVSDRSVVSVDSSTGEVLPKANGKATVYAVSDNKLKQAVCEITVNVVIPVTELTFSENTLTFNEKGASSKASVTISPENATDKTVVFSSSDTSVATVDNSGKITAVANGTAKITASANNGQATAELTVTVDIPVNVAVTGVSFAKESYAFAEPGDSMTLSYSVSPPNATNKSVSFSSSAPDIVSVDTNGKITALKPGSSTITVTTADGKHTAVFTASVADPAPPELIPEEGNTEDDENDTTIPVGAASDGLHGIWVASVSNIDFPSKPGLSADELRAEIDTIVNNAAEWGFNAIFFQVRPKSDALYSSLLFPTSDCLVQNQGDPLTLDCLEYFITASHAKGIELHAWVNPYRVLQSGTGGHKTELLADTNPAKLHPEWLVKHTDGATYFNPGIPEVRQLVIDGILEIVKNYNIDGIHFDDYFYPYNNAADFDDADEYEKYKSEGQSVSDWRRENNDKLIEQTAKAIKAVKPNVAFGVSPCGVWALKSNNSLGTDIKSSSEAYYQIFADTRKWVVNEWLDYICPQVYWEMNHSTAPFAPIVDWWDELVSKTKVRLYIGIAAYKGSSAPAYSTPAEIQTQLNYLKSKANVSGSVFFSYRDVVKNSAGVRDTAKAFFTSSGAVSAASDKLVLAYSKLNVENTTTKTFIIGVSDPNYPLIIAGEEVTTRSPKGYFTFIVDVPKVGENHYKIEHKGETVDYIITKSDEYSESTTMSKFGFVSGTCSPKYDRAEASGEKIGFSCAATAGANVSVIIGDYTVSLTSYTKDSTDGSLKRAWYEGSLILPELIGNVVLGKPVFVIEKDGYDTVRYESENTIEVINDPSSYVVEFTVDTAQLKPNLSVTGEDYLYATLGACDTVVSKFDNNTKLGSGFYTLNENITPVSGETLSLSAAGKITLSQSADGKYTNVIIPTDGKIMSTVKLRDSSAEITLYNLSSIPADFSVAENPLFSGASVSRVDTTTAKITLEYKKELYIFGYSNSFTDSALVIGFKNPVPLYDSEEFPLYGIKISIDPGHSLNGGALGPWGTVKWTEADWNYTLSTLVEERLIALGATIRMSHRRELEDDLDPLIVEFRAWKPDINVSIHFNYVGEMSNPLNTSGVVTYYSYTSSKLLSKVMLEEFAEGTGLKKNDYKIGYYKVSMFPDFPSILFETAFMSNIYDFEWFTEDANMEKAADAIVDGIVEYFRQQG